MPNEPLDALIRLLRATPGGDAPTLEQERAGFDEIGRLLPIPAGTVAERTDVAGVPCEWVMAPGTGRKRPLVYLHGGGYVVGSLDSHRSIASRLSAACQRAVLNVGYRLAPEHRFPAAVDDAVAAYRGLLAHGVPAPAIAIAGESAGGGLLVAALVAARDSRLPLPAAAVCISPWTDLALDGASIAKRAALDPMVTEAALRRSAARYLGDADPRSPLASPLYADLTGLPPLLIQVGGSEVLFDDAARLAERARRHGVTAVLEEWPEMVHAFPLFGGLLPEADAAVAAIAAFLASPAAQPSRSSTAR